MYVRQEKAVAVPHLSPRGGCGNDIVVCVILIRSKYHDGKPQIYTPTTNTAYDNFRENNCSNDNNDNSGNGNQQMENGCQRRLSS